MTLENLIIEYQNGSNNVEQIIKHRDTQIFILHCYKILCPSYNLSTDEVLSLIWEGFPSAARRFDINLNNSFTTYWKFWVLHYLKCHVYKAKMNGIFKNPHASRYHTRIHAYLDDNPDATDEEIQKALNMPTLNLVKFLKTISMNYVELDKSNYNDDGKEISLPTLSYNNPYENEFNPRYGDLDEALLILSDRDREILIKRYGLDGEGIRTLKELGQEYKLTEERIRQIQRHSEKRLKEYLKRHR